MMPWTIPEPLVGREIFFANIRRGFYNFFATILFLVDHAAGIGTLYARDAGVERWP